MPQKKANPKNDIQLWTRCVFDSNCYPILPMGDLICYPTSTISLESGSRDMYESLEKLLTLKHGNLVLTHLTVNELGPDHVAQDLQADQVAGTLEAAKPSDEPGTPEAAGSSDGAGLAEDAVPTEASGTSDDDPDALPRPKYQILYAPIGCLCRVTSFEVMPPENAKSTKISPAGELMTEEEESFRFQMVVEAQQRVTLKEVIECNRYDIFCRLDPLPNEELSEEEEAALTKLLPDIVEKIRILGEAMHPNFVDFNKVMGALRETSPTVLMDQVCSILAVDLGFKQEQLEETNLLRRGQALLEKLDVLAKEYPITPISPSLFSRSGPSSDKRTDQPLHLAKLPERLRAALTRGDIDPLDYLEAEHWEYQKESYDRTKELIDKMKLYRETVSTQGVINYYRQLLEKPQMDDEVMKVVVQEIVNVEKSMKEGASAEANVSRTWLDFVLSLPFGSYTVENHDVAEARKILDKDHYGLKDVKERILEYLSVLHLRHQQINPGEKVTERTDLADGAIICLVGPPGVGKTSIVKSIAKATGRTYVRMSLGGVNDEAEIRGHRKTYVAAMPGRILSAVKRAGNDNPLILLDEIDKLTESRNGSPTSALLEVLDPAQNNSFVDHFVGQPYDLSKVLFMTTANYEANIPAPLRDRMEIIRLDGYIDSEKLEIARRHLIPKVLEEHGIKPSQLKISKKALELIIQRYTREAGLRELERQLEKLARRGANQLAEQGVKSISVSQRNLESFLGIPIYYDNATKMRPALGTVYGLAVTELGGELLRVEVNSFPGTGKIELTGHLGDVMKESAKTALGYLRSQAETYGISEFFPDKVDMHIHVPAGATPKEGPSAGITLASAMLSQLTKTPVRRDVAMTGEISLHGDILPIGGLKGKTAAAYRHHIKTVIYPKENESELQDIPKEIREGLTMIPVSHFEDLIPKLFESRPYLHKEQEPAAATAKDGEAEDRASFASAKKEVL